jgi:hypothetical protein
MPDLDAHLSSHAALSQWFGLPVMVTGPGCADGSAWPLAL